MENANLFAESGPENSKRTILAAKFSWCVASHPRAVGQRPPRGRLGGADREGAAHRLDVTLVVELLRAARGGGDTRYLRDK
jgi:hypothetical protein